MIRYWVGIGLLLLSTAALAQDAAQTQEPGAVKYAFEFPIAAPTEAQIKEAYDCVLDSNSNVEGTPEATQETEPVTEDHSACALANQALSMAAQRGENTTPSNAEYKLFYRLIDANPALALRLSVIAAYFNTPALVAPPKVTDQAITTLHLTYTFSGLGPSNQYDITITNADKSPKVTGDVNKEGDMEGSETNATEAPLTLAKTIDADLVQALAPAMSDLLPIASQFSSVPCWDYYPDWVVEVTFADQTTLTVVTNKSNIVGIGGPWQVEIDKQNYMQYSGSFATAVSNLLEALKLPLGETAAMGCGGVNDPLYDAYPKSNK